MSLAIDAEAWINAKKEKCEWCAGLQRLFAPHSALQATESHHQPHQEFFNSLTINPNHPIFSHFLQIQLSC
jgi:hypothetical protein